MWGQSQASGKAIPLNVTPVAPATPGAMVVIGGNGRKRVAWSQQAAARDYAQRRGCSEDRALVELAGLPHVSWHIAHHATCPSAASLRKGR